MIERLPNDASTQQGALRPKAAAAWLGISERTLWQLTSDGEIPCVRLSTRLVLYPVHVLQAWLDARTSEGGDA